jgi:flagellar biosynthesis/type III secretory pathway protein FliH
MKLFKVLLEALEANQALEEEQRREVGPARMQLAEHVLATTAEEFEDNLRELVKEELAKLEGEKSTC